MDAGNERGTKGTHGEEGDGRLGKQKKSDGKKTRWQPPKRHCTKGKKLWERRDKGTTNARGEAGGKKG